MHDFRIFKTTREDILTQFSYTPYDRLGDSNEMLGIRIALCSYKNASDKIVLGFPANCGT